MRGQADILFLTVVMIALSISFIVIFFLYGQIHTAIAPVLNPTNSSNTTVAKVFVGTQSALTDMGMLLVLVYFAIGIAAIIAAFFVEAMPIFYVVSVFVLAIQIFVAAIMHNVFFTIVQQQIFATTASQFPLLLTIFQYYPELTLIISLGVIVALYSK